MNNLPCLAGNALLKSSLKNPLRSIFILTGHYDMLSAYPKIILPLAGPSSPLLVA
jgi:hypothetical protein